MDRLSHSGCQRGMTTATPQISINLYTRDEIYWKLSTLMSAWDLESWMLRTDTDYTHTVDQGTDEDEGWMWEIPYLCSGKQLGFGLRRWAGIHGDNRLRMSRMSSGGGCGQGGRGKSKGYFPCLGETGWDGELKREARGNRRWIASGSRELTGGGVWKWSTKILTGVLLESKGLVGDGLGGVWSCTWGCDWVKDWWSGVVRCSWIFVKLTTWITSDGLK